MAEHSYQPPVDKFLTYGDPRGSTDQWPNYLSLGFTAEHIPELIRMALDPELNRSDFNSREIWAPIHALRTLGQLRAESAIDPLIPLLDKTDDNDWLAEELPEVFAEIGPAAIPALSAYLDNLTNPNFARVVTVADGLTEIAKRYPEARQAVVQELTKELNRPDHNDPGANGFIIGNLVDLGAVESAEAIKAAFYADKVDPMVAGDWYKIREDLGLDPSVEVPGPDPEHFDRRAGFSELAFPRVGGPTSGHKSSKNAKNKRKQEKKSRKQNRKKK